MCSKLIALSILLFFLNKVFVEQLIVLLTSNNCDLAPQRGINKEE